MGTLDIDGMNRMFLGKDEAETLAKFAREDGCSKIYKFRARSDGPYVHYMPIRQPRDEQAMFSSQWVFDPVLVWPIESRDIPLLGNFQTITAEAETSTEAFELAKSKIPQDYEIFLSDVTRPEEKVLKTLTFEASTLEEARAQAQIECVEGMVFLREIVSSPGGRRKREGHGWTDQEAEQMAINLVHREAPGVKDIQTNITVPASQTLVQASGKNEQDAKVKVARMKPIASEVWNFRSTRLIKKAPKILLSLGIMQNQYEFTLAKEGFVEAWYPESAKIEMRYGSVGKSKATLTVGCKVT